MHASSNISHRLEAALFSSLADQMSGHDISDRALSFTGPILTYTALLSGNVGMNDRLP